MMTSSAARAGTRPPRYAAARATARCCKGDAVRQARYDVFKPEGARVKRICAAEERRCTERANRNGMRGCREGSREERATPEERRAQVPPGAAATAAEINAVARRKREEYREQREKGEVKPALPCNAWCSRVR